MSGRSPLLRKVFLRIRLVWEKPLSLLVSLPRHPAYLLSLELQLLLFPFGHWYDTRIFFGTAAGVAHGMSPYSYFDLGAYYHSASLTGLAPGIGYAPPWAIFLAAMYDIAYVPSQNPLVLNLAIKMPIILGNLFLARFVRTTLQARGCPPDWARRAELLVLFNPFLLYTSTFWNMYDTLVVLLFLYSLDYLEKARHGTAGLLLGISIALKHLALPLVPLGWLWIATRPLPLRDRLRNLASYSTAVLGVAGALAFGPFFVFGWPLSGFEAAAGYQAQVTGGFTLYQFLSVDLSSPTPLALLGYLPAIAVAITYGFLYKTPLKDFADLSQVALIITFVFMTTRTWVSEQNLALVFPLVLFPELLRGHGFRFANSLWIIFFIYTVLNTIPFQFAFLLIPDAPLTAANFAGSAILGPLRVAILPGCVVAWMALAWAYVMRNA